MDEKTQLIEHWRQQHQKIVYYILALTVTCVGFSVVQTKGVPFKWTHFVLVTSMLSWGYSIFSGLQVLYLSISVMRRNLVLLDALANIKLLREKSPKVNKEEVSIIEKNQAVVKEEGELIEEEGNASEKMASRQANFFVYGVVIFAVWHVLEMIVLSIE